MPLSPAGVAQVPNYWTVFGHSYVTFSFGTRTQAGRADALFRNLLNVDHTSFTNLAGNGSMLTKEGQSASGWTLLMQNLQGFEVGAGAGGQTGSAPYVAGGGSYLLAWGINDLGNNGNTAQFNSAYIQALRSVISRCRASVIREDTDASMTYGANFTQAAFTTEFSSGGTMQKCLVTGANSTATLTLPADYNGEVVVVEFSVPAGVNGGVVTFSGTTGVSGTLSLSNVVPSTASHVPVVQRFKTLTSANAGQTIIITVTSVDAGTPQINFDSWWLEAKNPNPVLVCNTARLLTAGYAAYSTGIGDTDVVTFNAGLPGLVAEFDGMVQIVDIDSALNKDTTKFNSDGLHPNELGAAAISDAILAAVRRLPANQWGVAASIQPPAPRSAALVLPQLFGQWFTSQTMGGATGTNYTAVSGDVFALPFEVTSGITSWSRWSVELIASTVATSVFFCVYTDRRYTGYPQQIYASPANVAGTPFPLTTGAGAKLSPTSAGNGFMIRNFVDPGLYWLVLKISTAGTTTFRTMKGPSLFVPNCIAGAGGPASTTCGWFLSGQGTGVLPGTFPALSNATAVDNVPMVGILQG
jgi:hypothetical protein